MIPKERRKQILDLLEKNKYMTVQSLAKEIYVSEPTIRRDLAYLEKEGSLKRSRGGASYINPTATRWPFVFRNKRNISQKMDIGKLAASFIEYGDSIFIDSSSTCLCLAKEIQQDIAIDALTYGIPAAQMLGENPNIFVELPGGKYHPTRACVYGKETCDYFASHHANICFLSGYGFDAEHGMTEYSREEFTLKKVLHANADRTIVLMDHTKMNRTYYRKVLPLSEIDILITDQPLPTEIEQACYQHDIHVLIADPS
jgi:DeoR/GlpR family transcriptional regulator of sugar metabolism